MDKPSKIDRLSKDNIKPVAQGAVGSLLAQLGWVGVPAMMSSLATFAAFLAGYGPLWVIVFGAVVLLIVVVAMYLVRIQIEKRRQQLGELPTGTSQALPAVNVSAVEVEKLESLIKELEQEKTDLENSIKSNTKTIEKYGAEIERLKKSNLDIDILFRERDSRLNRLNEQYGWLHEMADEQAKDVSHYLEVSVHICYHKADDHLPRIVFAVNIYNKSVFSIAIEDAMGGNIEVGGHRLFGGKQFLYKPKISPSSENSLTLEQRLTPEEDKLVVENLHSIFGANFSFDKLNIIVRSDTPFPQFNRARLPLPRYIQTPPQSM